MNDKEKDFKEMREILKALLEIQYEYRKDMREHREEIKRIDIEYKKDMREHREEIKRIDIEYRKRMEKINREYKEEMEKREERDRKNKEEIEKKDKKYKEEMEKRDKEYKEETKKRDKEYKEEMEKRDRQYREDMKRINEERKENERKYREDMKRINKEMGNTANSRGDILEYNIFTSLRNTMFLDNIRYDRIYTKLKVKNNEQEFDIVLENGKYIAIIEVKCQARIHDLESTAKLAEQYRRDFKEDADKEIRVYLAAAVFKDDVINESKRNSVKLLTIKNDIVEVLKGDNKKQ